MLPEPAPGIDAGGPAGAVAGLPGGDRSPALRPALLRGDERGARGARKDREVPPPHGAATSRRHLLQIRDRARMNDNDRELDRLMNDQLDGTATPEESERLSRALESREDVRSEYRKLGGVFAALSRIEMEEPPASLKQGVLRAIRANDADAAARQNWLDSIVSLVRDRAGFRYAYSFATGAALGVLAFALL